MELEANQPEDVTEEEQLDSYEDMETLSALSSQILWNLKRDEQGSLEAAGSDIQPKAHEKSPSSTTDARTIDRDVGGQSPEALVTPSFGRAGARPRPPIVPKLHFT